MSECRIPGQTLRHVGLRRVSIPRLRKRLLSIVFLTLMLAGCATVAHRGWTRSEIYFGLQRRDGRLVTESEWESFVQQVVTPRFPEGLTVFEGAGQWRNAAGEVERERTKVMVILHPTDELPGAKIDEVRRLYCERFDQGAVMKVTSPARVAF